MMKALTRHILWHSLASTFSGVLPAFFFAGPDSLARMIHGNIATIMARINHRSIRLFSLLFAEDASSFIDKDWWFRDCTTSYGTSSMEIRHCSVFNKTLTSLFVKSESTICFHE